MPIAKWKVVGVAGAPRRVQSVALSEVGLNSFITSVLGGLAELRILDLSENDLTGAVPSALGRLSKLTQLELSENGLSGGIPSQLGSLSNLEMLRMGKNQLTGSIPAELAGCVVCRGCHSLYDNLLTGPIPAPSHAPGHTSQRQLGLLITNVTPPQVWCYHIARRDTREYSNVERGVTINREGALDRVLITGAAGFGGSHITRALLDHGYRVTAMDVSPPSHAVLLESVLDHPELKYLWKSVQDVQPSDVAGHAIVIHLAAQPDTPLAFESPRYTVMQNVGGTVELLEAVRRAGEVSKVLFAASGNEVGRARYLPMDEDHPLTPHNPYGFSKAAAELAMWTWHRAYNVPSVVLSTGVVVGPHMRREVFIFKWLWNALQGRPIIVEGGRQTRDVTFIGDMVEAWMSAIEAPTDAVVGQKFYVGCGQEIAVEDLAKMCRAAAGGEVPIEYVQYRPGEQGQREAFSTEKARRVLGYEPKTSPVEAISLTAGWVRSLLESSPGKEQVTFEAPQ